MAIPRDRAPDSTLSMLNEGYPFIVERCRRYGADLFEARIMMRKTICMTGPEAAKVFYRPGLLTRRKSMPPTTVRLLQDFGSVQMLDDDHHRHRKSLFLSLLDESGVESLAWEAEHQWRASLPRWERLGGVVLLDEVRALLCRAVCDWSGLRLSGSEVSSRTEEFAAMIDGAGSVGPRNWRAQALRARSERWFERVFELIRSGAVPVPDHSAVHVIAWHREPGGNLLSAKTAAVELLNLLRPTVAVAHWVVFAAHALYRHPRWRASLREGAGEEQFVQELRRYYPFFPFVAGRVRRSFDWAGYRFTPGLRVLLDLFGTNRDPRSWEQPELFRPERFAERAPGPYELIPQGGGDHRHGHRCAGEGATIRLLKVALKYLTRLDYRVPEQNLRISLSRMPAIPESGFIIDEIRGHEIRQRDQWTSA